jgi:hypothetical protein
MSPLKDSASPNQVCWDAAARSEVMNTIALDVSEAVFRATHSPSFVQQQGQKHGVFVRIREGEFLDDFLSPSHTHVFNIAVGDSGTGKSHLIKCMYLETLRRNRTETPAYWLVLIPRSSTNLADVVRRVIEGFTGEVASRLREELKKQHGLSLGEAKNRIVDELGYVLDIEPGRGESAGLTEEEEQVRRDLPALIRDHKLRSVLFGRSNGAVTRVANHVLGHRQDAGETDLRWSSHDLEFSAVETQGAGGTARELALFLREDDNLRETAVRFLNAAQPQALRQLLRFRSGDMKAALEEVRQELLLQGKELVLFIEDLSITEGLDAELIEALQVRTRDAGKELCRLRSIVGVTKDDHARMRENIAEGRTLRTVFFNMPLASNRESGVTRTEVVEFASRYLNAARYSLNELAEWAATSPDGELPSACQGCSARSTCHGAFKAVGGRGLYPFTPEALSRLYDQVASARGGGDRAFNPRLLVGRVLNEVLAEAEQSIPRQTYPRSTLLEMFGLKNVQAVVEVDLRRYGVHADRMLRAIDLYAADPTALNPLLPEPVTTALGLPALSWSGSGNQSPGPRKSPEPVRHADPLPKVSEPSPLPPLTVAKLDVFDRWLREERLSDADLNKWRLAVHGGITAWIDWDAERVGFAKSKFKTTCIRFEGQFTKAPATDVALEIKRSPEVAIALRVLTEASPETAGAAQAEKQMVWVRQNLESWGLDVVAQLRRLYSEPGEPSPTELAARLLAVGALVTGSASPDSPIHDALAGTLAEWPPSSPQHSSEAWSSLLGAFSKRHGAVRELVIQILSCSKGGRVGGMLDVSSILTAIRAAMSEGSCGGLPTEAATWRLWKEVGDLGRDVLARLGPAADAEKQTWLAVRDEILAKLGEGDLKALVRVVQEAVKAAGEAGVLRSGGVSNFPVKLTEWASVNSNVRLKDVDRLRDATGPELLYVLGRLDRQFLHDLQGFLTEAKTVCEASVGAADATVGQLGKDADPDAIEAEVLEIVKSLDSTLQELGSEE